VLRGFLLVDIAARKRAWASMVASISGARLERDFHASQSWAMMKNTGGMSKNNTW